MKYLANRKKICVYYLVAMTALFGAVDANASFLSSLRNAFSGMSRTLQQAYNKGIDSASDFANDLNSNLADAGRTVAGSTVGAAQDLNNDLNAVANKSYKSAAAGIDEVNSAKNVLNDANSALAEANRIYSDALAEVERLARQELDRLLNAAYGDLKAAHLDELASVSKIADGEFWTKTVLHTVAKDITGSTVVGDAAATVSAISNGMGTPSPQHPFGDGNYGLAIENAMNSILAQAVVGAKGELSALNPLKNPNLKYDPKKYAKTFCDYFEYELPDPLQFKYELALQVKPITITWTNFAYHEGGRTQVDDSKVGFALKVPIISGDWNKEDTVLSNAVKKSRFAFQVSLFTAGTNTKKQQELANGTELKAEAQLAFDVVCSTQDIGQCQLQKIGFKDKYSRTQEADATNLARPILQAINSVLTAVENPIALSVLFGSDSSRKAEFKSAIGGIQGFVAGAYKIATIIEPPTRTAAENGLDLMDSIGLFSPLAELSKSADKLSYGVLGDSSLAQSFIGPMELFVPGVKSYTKGGTTYYDDSVEYDENGNAKRGADGKAVKSGAKSWKSKAAYVEKSAVDLSIGIQWLNDDYMNGIFKAGFKPTDRTRQQGTPQILTIEVGKTVNGEFKIGTAPNSENAKSTIKSDDDFELAFTASLDSRASFGLSIPFHKQASEWLSAQNHDTPSPLSDVDLAAIIQGAGNDPYNIGSSRSWSNPVDAAVLPTVLAAGAVHDVLTLPAFMAVLPR